MNKMTTDKPRRMRDVMGELEQTIHQETFNISKFREPIDTHVTLPKGDYRIDFDIQIEPGGILEIAPGAQLLFDRYKGLTCRGTLLAIGGKGKEIIFTSQTRSWRNIALVAKSSQDSVMKYCTVSNGRGALPSVYGYAGRPTHLGGAIVLVDSRLTLEDCILEDNAAYDGGGIRIYNSICELARVKILRNSAVESGGGICLESDSRLTIEDCTLEYNTARNGGGISIYSSICGLARVKILRNSSKRKGGGISAYKSRLVIKRSTIAQNSSNTQREGVNTGGGIYYEGNSPQLSNCIIQFNKPSNIDYLDHPI
jgi:hypothetical protein